MKMTKKLLNATIRLMINNAEDCIRTFYFHNDLEEWKKIPVEDGSSLDRYAKYYDTYYVKLNVNDVLKVYESDDRVDWKESKSLTLYKIPVTYTVTSDVEVYASNLEEAKDIIASENLSHIDFSDGDPEFLSNLELDVSRQCYPSK